MSKVLSHAEIETFMETGAVYLRGVVPAHVVARVQELVWLRLQLSPHEPARWPRERRIEDSFSGPPFDDAFTPRLEGAYDDLMGAGRWETNRHLGGWPVSFPGFDSGPWHPPERGWHVDGLFHHHINAREQALLPLFIFSDIEPGDGGTAWVPGSHRYVARVLAAAQPHGLAVTELGQAVATVPRTGALEATGQAGDVVLMHPFMLHTRSMNTGTRVRIICNPCMSLHAPMQLARPDDAYSPVERAIVQALQVQTAA